MTTRIIETIGSRTAEAIGRELAGLRARLELLEGIQESYGADAPGLIYAKPDSMIPAATLNGDDLVPGKGDAKIFRYNGSAARWQERETEEIWNTTFTPLPADIFQEVHQENFTGRLVPSSLHPQRIIGRSVGVIEAGTTGNIDNLRVLHGSFNVTGPTQTLSVYLPTDNQDTIDDAKVWAQWVNAGRWEIYHIEGPTGGGGAFDCTALDGYDAGVPQVLVHLIGETCKWVEIDDGCP